MVGTVIHSPLRKQTNFASSAAPGHEIQCVEPWLGHQNGRSYCSLHCAVCGLLYSSFVDSLKSNSTTATNMWSEKAENWQTDARRRFQHKWLASLFRFSVDAVEKESWGVARWNTVYVLCVLSMFLQLYRNHFQLHLKIRSWSMFFFVDSSRCLLSL